MANNLVKKMEKRVEKLKDELEVERARVRPASPEVYIDYLLHRLRNDIIPSRNLMYRVQLTIQVLTKLKLRSCLQK